MRITVDFWVGVGWLVHDCEYDLIFVHFVLNNANKLFRCIDFLYWVVVIQFNT